jgi:hypothetical protein
MKARLAWLLAFCSWFPWSGVAASLAMTHEIVSCAVIIVLADGSSGSGFYWNREGRIFLVTARHILFAADGDTDKHPLKLKSNQAIFRSPVPVPGPMHEGIPCRLVSVWALLWKDFGRTAGCRND